MTFVINNGLHNKKLSGNYKNTKRAVRLEIIGKSSYNNLQEEQETRLIAVFSAPADIRCDHKNINPCEER